MAKVKPEYEVVNEFSLLANKIIDKYPDVFYGIMVDKIRCVKIINKERPEGKNKLWELLAVKMPIRLDCPYAWYISIHANDWNERDEKHKLLLVAEILHGVPKNEDEEGKVNPFDIKGFGRMFRTFNSIDYLEASSVPHILEDDINWSKI